MNTKQIIAIAAPIALLLVMYLIFRLLAKFFGAEWRIGWFLGLAIYWLTWGFVFPWLLIGKESIIELIQPQQVNLKIFLLAIIPIALSGLYKLVPNMKYEKPNAWIFILVISTCFGNGIFEEILWRGIYLELFPHNILFGLVWPSLFFALWHAIPGSMNPNGNIAGLMIGSGLMGFYLSFLARQTGTIWWTMIIHIIGGIIMVL